MKWIRFIYFGDGQSLIEYSPLALFAVCVSVVIVAQIVKAN